MLTVWCRSSFITVGVLFVPHGTCQRCCATRPFDEFITSDSECPCANVNGLLSTRPIEYTHWNTMCGCMKIFRQISSSSEHVCSFNLDFLSVLIFVGYWPIWPPELCCMRSGIIRYSIRRKDIRTFISRSIAEPYI
jgi:hypothetical protein